LKSALATGSFRERLGQARRRSQMEEFGNILSQLEHLKSFYCEEEEAEMTQLYVKNINRQLEKFLTNPKERA
jgi:hypothetical protein